MKNTKTKFFALAFVCLLILFFSNDFGLIDIEKTAIITAVAIDINEDGTYKATAQIAVPEASDTATENQKTQVDGVGSTIGSAIKNIGDISGWYPNLYFCNLIAIGNTFDNYNVIKVLDYFSKTLRVQDSALVVYTEGKAKDILTASSPLDNISSFALQKILLKNPGFDSDVAETDIKTFTIGYYSYGNSSFMPLIKKEIQQETPSGEGEGGAGNQGSPESGTKGDTLFNANTTALFLSGRKVGELSPRLTQIFNALTLDIKGTTLEVNDVDTETGKENFLLTVFRNKHKITVKADESGIQLNISLTLQCKISDRNSIYSDVSYVKNEPIPNNVKLKIEQDLESGIEELVEYSRLTGCDLFKVKEKIYRYNHGYFDLYKQGYLDKVYPVIAVKVEGQK